jgi:hypothetical protein
MYLLIAHIVVVQHGAADISYGRSGLIIFLFLRNSVSIRLFLQKPMWLSQPSDFFCLVVALA